jgi:hypothetical protein
MWQGNKGFDLWDQGFLWYGAQRVMLGEVPIRDFMAYDPGRYYWSAGFMWLWGDNGIMALRIAGAIFQTIGLFVSLHLINTITRGQNFLYLILSAIILVVWMFLPYKSFDIATSIFLIGALTYLVESPKLQRYFLVGVCVGLAAVFGRNHGAYGVLASIGIIIWLKMSYLEGPGITKGFFFWGVGILVGFMPIFCMMLLLPGFSNAFLESIFFLFRVKATNLYLPIPWPWRVNFALPFGEVIRGLLIGLFFIGLFIFGVLSLIWVVWKRKRRLPSVLVATSFLALPYAHYAYSRADVAHLSLGIFPSLIGCLAFLATKSTKVKWSFAVMLCIASVWVMLVFQQGWYCHVNECVKVNISGSSFKVDLPTAKDIQLLHQLNDLYAPNDESFIVTPFWPGAYALLQRKSPMWEIYALFPSVSDFEKAEIRRIEKANPRFALVLDYPLDGRDDLRFQNTHPLIHQYIVKHFELVRGVSNNPIFQVYKARNMRAERRLIEDNKYD